MHMKEYRNRIDILERWKMKLKESFITYEENGEQIMVAAGTEAFCGLVRSNGTAAFIVDKLKNETTAEEIAEAMAQEYQASKEVILRDVNTVIDKLREIDALDE